MLSLYYGCLGNELLADRIPGGVWGQQQRLANEGDEAAHGESKCKIYTEWMRPEMGRIFWRARGAPGPPARSGGSKQTALTYPEREPVSQRWVRKKEKLKMSLGANFKNMKQLQLRGHALCRGLCTHHLL